MDISGRSSGTPAPLWRNREFLLLQSGQFLSALGGSVTSIAYPLLVLAVSGSARDAGLVGFARIAPFGLFAVFAGVASDTWSRRRLMIVSDAVGVAAMSTLALLIVFGKAAVWHILVLGFVEGTAATVFNAAWSGAFRSIVAAEQLPAAFGANEGRRALQRLAGPPAGGGLYALSHTVPFLVDAVSYMFSTLSLLLIRTPFEELRKRDAVAVRTRIADGFRFLWAQPFLRTCAFLYGNFLAPAMGLVLVVVAKRQGLSPGAIGALTATLGVGILLGSVASSIVRKTLSVRAILLCEFWTWSAAWAFVLWPNAYVLAAALTLFGAAAPITDSVVMALGLALTPDRLVGRVQSIRLNIALLAAPVGPLAAGLLLGATTARATVAVLAAGGLGLALCGTASRAIRAAPSLAELGAK
jgi:Transmembrane secretion effector